MTDVQDFDRVDKKVILILGGNGFIGAEVTEYLLDNLDLNQYELVLANRDNWEGWDSYERIRKRVKTNINVDRKHGSLRSALQSYLSRENFQFFAIVDLSGYYSSYIQKALNDIPASMINLYLYISTDSVYEVCQVNKVGPSGLKETDSIRPESLVLRNELRDFDDYAHEKLE